MNRTILFLTFLTLFSNSIQGQSYAEEFVNQIKRNYYIDDIKAELANYNFSSLIYPNGDFLGFIGSKYRRIKIFYNAIEKDKADPFKYYIKGISVVGNNKCDFSGELTVQSIHKAKRMELGADLMYESVGFQSQGIMIADYKFHEDKSQNHVGIFSGKMLIWWLIDRHGILHLNDVNDYSDNYKNNQHVGTWTEYGSTNSKICNWGFRRIPDSGDLDIGTGEFAVNPKYKELGWEFYRAF